LPHICIEQGSRFGNLLSFLNFRSNLWNLCEAPVFQSIFSVPILKSDRVRRCWWNERAKRRGTLLSDVF